MFSSMSSAVAGSGAPAPLAGSFPFQLPLPKSLVVREHNSHGPIYALLLYRQQGVEIRGHGH
jgi:hypothetical protein